MTDIVINTTIGELHFEETCVACPEQYDIWYTKDALRYLVGYVRLRGGRFRVNAPNVSGEEIYVYEWEDDYWKGQFDDDTERYEYLTKAAHAIADWVILNNYGVGDDEDEPTQELTELMKLHQRVTK